MNHLFITCPRKNTSSLLRVILDYCIGNPAEEQLFNMQPIEHDFRGSPHHCAEHCLQLARKKFIFWRTERVEGRGEAVFEPVPLSLFSFFPLSERVSTPNNEA